MDCENCTRGEKGQTSVELAMARLSATNKHLFIALLVTIVLFFLLASGSVALTVMLNNARIDALNEKIEAINELRELERSIETTYEYEYDVEQDADGGGSNFVLGGDYYGEAKSESQGQENDTP
jgi:hypothetical protein